MVSAAQLREEKLTVGRMKLGIATQQQREFYMEPVESSPNLSNKVRKVGNIISGRRKRLLQEVYDVDSESENGNSSSIRLVNSQIITETEASDEDNVVIASLRRKPISNKKLSGSKTCLKPIKEDVENQKMGNLFPETGLKSAFGATEEKYLSKDGEKIPEVTIDYKRLAREVGDVLVLRNLDLNCTSGAGLNVGLSVMKRVVDFGYQENLENSGAEALEVFGRMGLNISEFTTGGSFLVNKIDILQTSIKKTETMLARANKLIEEKEEEIWKNAQQLSNVEYKVEDIKRSAKEIEEKDASYLSRIAELETIAARYEQEKKDWCEDRSAWFSEKDELVADAEAAMKISWNEFVEQYENCNQYHKKLNEKTLGCYEQGIYHVLRMAAASDIQGITTERLADWAKTIPYGDEGRRGHLIVPFSKGEIRELKAYDEKNKMPKYDLPRPSDANVKILMGVSEDDDEQIVGEILPTS